MLQSNSMISSNFESDKVTIQENLTVYKKMLFIIKQNWQNNILICRLFGLLRAEYVLEKIQEAEKINVSSLHDLPKLGYSGHAANSNFTF